MTVRLLVGDCREQLRALADGSAQCCVTSPPYFGLRDYGVAGQIGLEASVEGYVAEIVTVFREVRRVLAEDGTLWLNLGDSYAGSGRGGNVGDGSSALGRGGRQPDHSRSAREAQRGKQHLHAERVALGVIGRGWVPPPAGLKQKDLIGVPWRVAFALQADGWWLRSAIVWAKPNGMPGSQEDRPTSSYEHVFLLSRSERYWSDFDAIKTPPREATLMRSVQDIQAQAGSHRANGGTKTNGPMRAAVRRKEKGRGHPKAHKGFEGRWDGMARKEQQADPAMIRDVWFIAPAGYKGAHYAVMPDEVARRCILAGCPEGGVVLDPFAGAGTSGLVADRLQRDAVLIELNPTNAELVRKRLRGDAPLFAEVVG